MFWEEHLPYFFWCLHSSGLKSESDFLSSLWNQKENIPGTKTIAYIYNRVFTLKRQHKSCIYTRKRCIYTDLLMLYISDINAFTLIIFSEIFLWNQFYKLETMNKLILWIIKYMLRHDDSKLEDSISFTQSQCSITGTSDTGTELAQSYHIYLVLFYVPLHCILAQNMEPAQQP